MTSGPSCKRRLPIPRRFLFDREAAASASASDDAIPAAIRVATIGKRWDSISVLLSFGTARHRDTGTVTPQWSLHVAFLKAKRAKEMPRAFVAPHDSEDEFHADLRGFGTFF